MPDDLGIAVSSLLFLHVLLTWPLPVPHKRCDGIIVQQRSIEVERQTDAEQGIGHVIFPNVRGAFAAAHTRYLASMEATLQKRSPRKPSTPVTNVGLSCTSRDHQTTRQVSELNL